MTALLNANGVKVYEQHFFPFGQKDKARSDKKPNACNNGGTSDPWPYGFTGQFHDVESGLIHMHARCYNAAIGHFMTPDSVVPNPDDPYCQPDSPKVSLLGHDSIRHSLQVVYPLKDPAGILLAGKGWPQHRARGFEWNATT